ncbi:MAG: ComEC/Rec2 family competence protein [Phycisphaerales bacterium]
MAAPSPGIPRVIPVAAGVVGGAAWAECVANGPAASAWMLVAAGVAIAVGTMVFLAPDRKHRTVPLVLLILAGLALGLGRAAVDERAAARGLAAALPAGPAVIVVEGIRRGADGTMPARPGLAGTPATWPLDVERFIVGGTPVAARGRIRVRAEGDPGTWPGEWVRVTGRWTPPAGPRWPGAFDAAGLAARRGMVGTIDAAEDAIHIVNAGRRPGSREQFAGWRATVRARAREAIGRRVGQTSDEGRARRALIGALVLGDRGPDLRGVSEMFRATGLAHVLAISGMHVGIVLGAALRLLRRGGRWRRTHGAWLLGVVAMMLILVDLRVPIVRATIGAAVAAVAMLAGRRRPALSVLGTAAMLVVLVRPRAVGDPGFQLSFGVVLALLLAASPTRQRWFGPPPPSINRWRDLAAQRLADGIAASAVAWAASLPIGLAHFGVAAPVGIGLSLVAVPIAAAALMAGGVVIACDALLPPVAWLAGILADVAAGALIGLVELADRLPMTPIETPRPPLAWAWIAATWITWRLARRPKGRGERERARKRLRARPKMPSRRSKPMPRPMPMPTQRRGRRKTRTRTRMKTQERKRTRSASHRQLIAGAITRAMPCRSIVCIVHPCFILTMIFIWPIGPRFNLGPTLTGTTTVQVIAARSRDIVLVQSPQHVALHLGGSAQNNSLPRLVRTIRDHGVWRLDRVVVHGGDGAHGRSRRTTAAALARTFGAGSPVIVGRDLAGSIDGSREGSLEWRLDADALTVRWESGPCLVLPARPDSTVHVQWRSSVACDGRWRRFGETWRPLHPRNSQSEPTDTDGLLGGDRQSIAARGWRRRIQGSIDSPVDVRSSAIARPRQSATTRPSEPARSDFRLALSTGVRDPLATWRVTSRTACTIGQRRSGGISEWCRPASCPATRN